MSNTRSTTNGTCLSEQQAIDRCVEAFQVALNQGQRPLLDDFLPAGPGAATALVELVHVELEFRLKRGEAAGVEEYLAHYPQLIESADVVVELVMAEYTFRRRCEPDLEGEDFLQRFPAHRTALAAHLAEANGGRTMLDRTLPMRVPAASEEAENFPSLPGYEILAELGRGAMGVVYKARQLALNRLVALKMLHVLREGDAEQRRRFRQEVETIALLQHANIVQIHDVGEHKGRPFFTMEYLDGGSLASHCRGQAQAPRLAAEWVETLARAMHAVHAKGIVHRDLKPSNVLRTAEGCLKIADFGLARQETSDLTASGDVLGTPSYMAPEQAAGKAREVGPAADVYALGTILYELLTGRPPFWGLSVLEIVRQVQDSDPLPPRRLEMRTPRDLETICLKCLRKEPHRRYASAAELADDLRRFRNGEAIRARPPAWPERAIRWLKRRPALSLLLATIVLAALTVPLALLAHTLRLQDALDREQRAREKTAQAEQRARLHATEAYLGRYVSDMQLAQNYLKMGDVFQLPRLLDRYRGADGVDEARRGFEWTYLQRHSQKARAVLRAHPGPLHLLAYSADGQSLITGGGDTIYISTLQVWDLSTGRSRFEKSLIPPSFPLFKLTSSAYAPHSGLLAGWSRDGVVTKETFVTLWDLASGQTRFRFPHAGEAKHIALSPDGRWLAANEASRTTLWSCATRQTHKILPIRGDTHLAFSPDGGTLLAASCSQTFAGLQFWDVATGTLREQRTFPFGVARVFFSPRGTYLLFIEGNMQGAIWSAQPRFALPLSSSLGDVRCLAVSDDEQTLACGDAEGRIRVWDIASGRLRGQYHWQPHEIVQLAFARDNRTLAAASDDGHVHQLDVSLSLFPDRLQAVTLLERPLAWSPDGETVAAAAWDGTVHLFHGRTAQTRRVLRGPIGMVCQLAFSPDGRTLAVVSERENFVRLWDVATGQPRAVTSSQLAPNPLIAFCPDGRLASVDGKTIRFWDAKGTACGSVETDQVIQALAFFPDGQALLTGNESVHIWNISDHNNRASRKAASLRLTSPVSYLAISPDGRRVATGEKEGTVRLWRLSSEGTLVPESSSWTWPNPKESLTNLQFRGDGKALLVFSRYGGWIRELRAGPYEHVLQGGVTYGSLSADGRTLATTASDGILRLWDVSTWRVRQPGGQALHGVTSLVFSADGRRLITGSHGPYLSVQHRKLWTVETATLRNTAESLRFWDALTGRELPSEAPDQETMALPCVLAPSPDGQLLAAGAEDGSVRIWDGTRRQWATRLFITEAAERRAKTCELARQLWTETNPDYPKRAEAACALAFSRDGRRLAAAGGWGSIRVWDTGDWKEISHWHVGSTWTPWLAFTPDSRGLAGSRGGQLCLWDAETGDPRATFGSQTDSRVVCGAFAPDKDLLALGSEDGTIVFRNLPSGDVKRLATTHRNRVTSLAFSLDGKTLASASWDRTVRLWHLAAGRQVAVLEGHKGRVNVVVFSPDGQTLVSGGDVDGSRSEVLFWR